MTAQPDRPVRLTVVSTDSGWAVIRAAGLRVGHVRRDYSKWTAWLWSHAEDRSGGYADAPVTRAALGDLRADLRERAELKGPWWT